MSHSLLESSTAVNNHRLQISGRESAHPVSKKGTLLPRPLRALGSSILLALG